MSEPPWRTALRQSVFDAITDAEANFEHLSKTSGTPTTDAVMAVVLPHLEAAFKRGHAAGSNRAKAREGSRLVRENSRLRAEARSGKEGR